MQKRKRFAVGLALMGLGATGCGSAPPPPKKSQVVKVSRVDELSKQLTKSSEELDRVRAARMLGEISDPAAGGALIAATEDREDIVRLAAVRALGKIGAVDGALKAVARTLNDPSAEVRDTAAGVFASLVGEVPAGLLEGVSYKNDAGQRILYPQTGTVLSRLADDPQSAVEGLIAEVVSNKHPVRNTAAVLGLVILGPAVTPTIQNAMKEQQGTTKVYLAEALWQADPEADAPKPIVAEALKSPDPKVRETALDATGRLGAKGADSVPQVTALLEDRVPVIRIRAARTLWKIDGQPTGVPMLVALYKKGDRETRVEALKILIEMGPDAIDALPAMIEAFASQSRDVQATAPKAVQLMFGAKAVPNLVEALKDDNPYVRRNAALTLGMIGPDSAPALPALVELVNNEKVFPVQREAMKAVNRINAKD